MATSSTKTKGGTNYGSVGGSDRRASAGAGAAAACDEVDHDSPQFSLLAKRRGSDASSHDRHSLAHSMRDVMSVAGSVSSSARDFLVGRALTHPGRPVSVRSLGGTSTVTRSSITLVKNIVGAGVLALPSGVAAFATTRAAVLPASIWLAVMGAAFAYEFQLIGRVCDVAVSATFREAWEDTVGRDEGLKWAGLLVSWVNMVKPFLANLAYSMILADTFRSLFATVGWDVTRTACLLLVSVVGILPLCLLKNLDALAPFSVLGTLSILVITVCMGIRCFDGTYDPVGGRYIEDLPAELRPVFGTYDGSWSAAVLVYVAMIFEAFVAHYNAPRFYAELDRANMARFRVVVANGFGASTVLYVLIMCFGFLTFGGNCDGYILNNYSVEDSLMTVSRFFISFSILFTYPVTFMGTRDGVMDILNLPEEKQTSANVNILTLVLLATITSLAVVTKDLGMINAVGGGSLATLIVFVFPALMYRAAVDHQVAPPTRAQRREVTFAMTLMVVGLIMGAIGVVVELAR